MGRQFGRILWDNLSQSGEFMRQFDRVLGFWDTIWKSLGILGDNLEEFGTIQFGVWGSKNCLEIAFFVNGGFL